MRKIQFYFLLFFYSVLSCTPSNLKLYSRDNDIKKFYSDSDYLEFFGQGVCNPNIISATKKKQLSYMAAKSDALKAMEAVLIDLVRTMKLDFEPETVARNIKVALKGSEVVSRHWDRLDECTVRMRVNTKKFVELLKESYQLENSDQELSKTRKIIKN